MQKGIQEQSQAPRILQVLQVFLGLFVAITSLIGALLLLSIALAKAIQQEGLRDRIRRFNKQTLNPLTLNIAGNRTRIYAAIRHIGRRSGKEYSTPVVTEPLGDGFVIPLPYGADVDWCRNVMAADTCKLLWNEQEYTLEKPEFIAPSQALGTFPLAQRFIFAAGGIKQYLWLHQHKESPVQA